MMKRWPNGLERVRMKGRIPERVTLTICFDISLTHGTLWPMLMSIYIKYTGQALYILVRLNIYIHGCPMESFGQAKEGFLKA